MELLKAQFDRVRQQLAGLTPSQRMLAGSLVVIMVMTLVWWSRYAGQPEWEPVFDQSLSTEETGRIDMELAGAGVEHKIVDGKVIVPAEKKVQAIAALATRNATPKNITSGFDEIIKQLTAWDGQDRQSAIFNHGKELTLERIIAAMPGVAGASVVIDPRRERAIGKDIEPTATVNVMLKDAAAAPSKPLATAIANLVAGAQAGLSLSRVQIVMNGRHIAVKDPTAPNGILSGPEGLELQMAVEKTLVDKIESLYPTIDGLRVAVTVQVNNATETIRENSYKKETSLIVDQQIQNRTKEEATTPGSSANEPATVPNLGASVAQATGAGPSRSNSDATESVTTHISPGHKEVNKVTPAGQATAVGASVRIPRSFFVRVARQRDPSKKEPDQALIDKCMAEEIATIQAAVKTCSSIKDPEGISVAPYTDFAPEDRGAQVVAAAGMAGMLGGHVKELALGGLALASLFMMTMIVRKGAPAPLAVAVAAAAPDAPATTRLEAIEAAAGEASGGDPALDGMELDDDSIKTQQMLGQVTQMVGESPDAAASLIKRWLNQR